MTPPRAAPRRVQIKKEILLEKEDSKQEIRMKKGGVLYEWEGDGLVSNNSTVEFSVN